MKKILTTTAIIAALATAATAGNWQDNFRWINNKAEQKGYITSVDDLEYASHVLDMTYGTGVEAGIVIGEESAADEVAVLTQLVADHEEAITRAYENGVEVGVLSIDVETIENVAYNEGFAAGTTNEVSDNDLIRTITDATLSSDFISEQFMNLDHYSDDIYTIESIQRGLTTNAIVNGNEDVTQEWYDHLAGLADGTNSSVIAQIELIAEAQAAQAAAEEAQAAAEQTLADEFVDFGNTLLATETFLNNIIDDQAATIADLEEQLERQEVQNRNFIDGLDDHYQTIIEEMTAENAATVAELTAENEALTEQLEDLQNAINLIFGGLGN